MKEPVTDVNRDYDEFDPDLADSFDFDEDVPENDRQDEEFNQGEESHQNENEEELSQKQNEEENKPELRRSARIAVLLLGETPCNDAIPTMTETFVRKPQKEANTDFDDDEEYYTVVYTHTTASI